MGYHLRNASKYFDLERREIKTVSGGSVMGGIGNGNDFFKSHFPNHRLLISEFLFGCPSTYGRGG
jgi:hypothetical protein